MATSDVFASPALPLLLRLEAEGFELAVREDRLLVRPVDRLASDLHELMAEHRTELVTLVRICDEGVQARRAAFAAQLEAGRGIASLAMSHVIPYVVGHCFSCAAELPRPVFGRCWRCALAWRLAAGVPIGAELGHAYDGSRVLA